MASPNLHRRLWTAVVPAIDGQPSGLGYGVAVPAIDGQPSGLGYRVAVPAIDGQPCDLDALGEGHDLIQVLPSPSYLCMQPPRWTLGQQGVCVHAHARASVCAPVACMRKPGRLGALSPPARGHNYVGHSYTGHNLEDREHCHLQPQPS